MRVWAVRYIPSWEDKTKDSWIADFAERDEALDFCNEKNLRFATGTPDNGGGYYIAEEEERDYHPFLSLQ